jgi:hypothetical protein
MYTQVRPTADRGPILLCVDTSGSMRGARETVAKALALECMRAAREQERDCYVFAFSGPSEVRCHCLARGGRGEKKCCAEKWQGGRGQGKMCCIKGRLEADSRKHGGKLDVWLPMIGW